MVEKIELSERCLYIGYSPLGIDKCKDNVHSVADITELKKLWKTQIMPQLLSTNIFKYLIIDTTTFVPSDEDLKKLTEEGMCTVITFPANVEGSLIIMDITNGVCFEIDKGGSDE